MDEEEIRICKEVLLQQLQHIKDSYPLPNPLHMDKSLEEIEMEFKLLEMYEKNKAQILYGMKNLLLIVHSVVRLTDNQKEQIKDKILKSCEDDFKNAKNMIRSMYGL